MWEQHINMMVGMDREKVAGFFFSSRRRHTRSLCDWSSDVCSSDLEIALAESSTLDSISKLWIEEGDLGKLLNDGASLEGLTGLVQQDPPVSLLNGERMYRILLNAFGQMVPGPSKVDAGDRIDLYVTTTDVRGEVVRLQLANGFSTEKRYRQAFHFVHEPAADRNDFADDRKARLAFAARCTSTF